MGGDGVNTEQYSGVLYDLYRHGINGDGGNIKDDLAKAGSPIAAFAMLTAFFAGKLEADMNVKMTEYEDQHKAYTTCLEMSKIAHAAKAAAGPDGSYEYAKEVTVMKDVKDVYSFLPPELLEKFPGKVPVTQRDMTYADYMENLMGSEQFEKMDPGDDKAYTFTTEQWDSQCQFLNKEKDIQSSELNRLSSQMELAVQDSSQAQEMSANAVKKLSDQLSTQAKNVGG